MNTLKHILPILLVCLLSACSADRYEKDLIGTWALETQNGQKADVNNFLVLQFMEDGTMTLSKMYGPDHSYKSRWIVSDATNRYELKGRRLYVEGITGNGLRFKQKAYIRHLDSLHLYKRVIEYHMGSIDQVATRGNYEQVFHKVDVNYPKPIGLWELVSLNGKSFTGFRFHFKEDGTYDLLMDINGQWEMKQDNNGTWFSYGEVLCTNFFNDIFKEGLSYENISQCYRFEISGTTMKWESNSPGSNSFLMKRVTIE